jgi:hypothetical protein
MTARRSRFMGYIGWPGTNELRLQLNTTSAVTTTADVMRYRRLMSTLIEPKSAMFSVLDVAAAILALAGLLPMAGGLPSIASPAIPFADVIWFTANLAGPALLLATGLRLLFRGMPMLWYVSGYTVLLMAAGELRFWLTGFHRLAFGWFIMALFIGVLLLILRRFWLWAVVGGLCSGLLLGLWSFGGIVAYKSASAALFPTLLLIQVTGALMALVIGLMHLRFRESKRPVDGVHVAVR